MMKPSSQRVLNAATALAFAALGVAHTRTAQADDGDVIRYGASQSFQYDSNLFRLPDGRQPNIGDQRYDWVSTTSLLLSLKKDFGRHSLVADFNHGFVKFFNFSRFNYQSENYSLAWKGGFGSDSSYGLAYQRRKSLSSFTDVSGNYKNIATSDDLSASLSLRVAAAWYLVGSTGFYKTKNSAIQEQGGDSERSSIEYGARYDPRTGNWIDIRARNAHVHYVNAVVEHVSDNARSDNTHDENELRLSGHWQPTYASTANARISYIDRKHEHLSQRDFGGWAGSLDYTWRSGDIFSVKLGATRALGAISDSSATYATTDRLSISPAWVPTAKLRFEAQGDWRRRIYKGDSVSLISIPQRREHVRGFQFAATYVPTRTAQLQTVLRREKRQGNDANLQYSDTSLTLFGQITF